MRYLLTLFVSMLCLLGTLISQPKDITSEKKSIEFTQISPLVVVRNIDQHLSKTTIEAMESGEARPYKDQINIAKSFVHAGNYEEAKKAYDEALRMVWQNSNYTVVSEKVELELKKANRSFSNGSRPAGLDENYQPENTKRNSSFELQESYTPHGAANKIDQMLSFLMSSVYKRRDEQLTLEGKLNDCRQLVIMESFDAAKSAYHSTIIAYLDPKWTGQLLEDIYLIIDRTEAVKTPSEINPGVQLNAQDTKDEIALLLQPMTEYYRDNQQMKSHLKAFWEQIDQGNKKEALKLISENFDLFANRQWIDNRLKRIEAILNRENGTGLSTSPTEAPILYFKENVEGRSIERLRIIEKRELVTYKKVSHTWGGHYYFKNDEPTKDTEWLRVWKLYKEQESAMSNNK
ncbi:MAG: hypothetical protein WEC59_13335 [Salibacteraceae bacterium]